MLKKLRNKKGFTLAELLIVVAIIGVLVAISIPIFTSQLEKAREATDLANIRSAYAECTTAVLTGEADDGVTEDKDTGAYSKSVDISQTKAGWLSSNADVKLAGKAVSSFTWKPADGANGSVKVTVNKDGTFDVTKN
ncbi:MAG: type II secretion system GspH family protein [Solobacterium sp.]|jgi:prepilin-type N-terminal cleavage/methylation domain-containing protein|nr:type II secretion system GspH family protein [Solobacterium sp.]MCH4049228.1 type II secretion system GspH family protein [Solobacterium sp.]MCH4074018.1 type II secretion system GspH family protein [Solobacterium sp.]MCI1314269.1 type II secretion system GspH family protein [Solobacterium sp.]MCI1346405.1 type II secretion system GspH family protein [Solobacterium sp.]